MKRLVAIFLCAVLGIAAGYFVAPLVSMAYVESAEPQLFGAFFTSLADSFAFCLCQAEPTVKSIATVTQSLNDFRAWHAKDPESSYLTQEVGLLEAQRARLELQVGQSAQAEQDIKDSQRELTAVGWRDVSQEHLLKVTAQITSEYDQQSASSGLAREPH
ncbi:MAG TPA: hypothetical protein VNK23_00595 [Candidatus Dormibacteraeota bacterium]|nr:hypothetical protein [Candidatus Dormibacteraeota bacterium]